MFHTFLIVLYNKDLWCRITEIEDRTYEDQDKNSARDTDEVEPL